MFEFNLEALISGAVVGAIIGIVAAYLAHWRSRQSLEAELAELTAKNEAQEAAYRRRYGVNK